MSIKLNYFDWFMILGVMAVSVLTSLLGGGSIDWLDFVGVTTGIINLVLCAKGNVANYAFGIVYNTIYCYIAFSSSLYADATVYALYYLPMQFVGWVQWSRNRNADSGALKATHLTWRVAAILLCVAALLVPLVAYILGLPAIADAQPWTDAASTVASIIAMYLMVKAVTEQWYIWFVINILLVVKWAVELAHGTQHAALWLILFAFYTANSVYGIIEWSRLARR